MNGGLASAWDDVRYLGWLFLKTSIGRKTLMGFTGLCLGGFLLFHLIGNSFLLEGATAFNAYAKLLHGLPVLPLAEGGLAACFLAHVGWGLLLTWQNWRARPVGYQVRTTAGSATVASRSMIYSGGVILLFLAYHLWSLHTGRLPAGAPWVRVRSIFAQPVSVAVYAAGFAALGLHLFHGFSSVLVTFGLRHRRHDAWVDLLSRAGALVLALGYAGLAAYCLLS